MVRQAKNYMVGAMSGAGLIAAAVIAFVVLVSALVFEDLPVAGLVGGGDEPSVSVAEPAAGAAGGGATAAATAANTGPGGTGAGKGQGTGGGAGGAAATGLTPTGTETAGGGETGGGGGGTGGSGGSPTTTAGSGGGSTGTASSSGGSGGGGGSTGGGTTTTSTSAKVTGTVNETVNQVDQTVTGGALEETGVTQTTEEVVNDVAGPESVVGKTVDETEKTVEGVLKPK